LEKEQEEYSHNSFPGHGKAKFTDEGREIARLKKDLYSYTGGVPVLCLFYNQKGKNKQLIYL